MPSGQRHRGRVGRAKVGDRCERVHARAAAAAGMHQSAPSTHRNRRSMGFANQVAGWWVRRLSEQWNDQRHVER
eukprot:4023531-Pyramimonas_sp.AAC.1